MTNTFLAATLTETNSYQLIAKTENADLLTESNFTVIYDRLTDFLGYNNVRVLDDGNDSIGMNDDTDTAWMESISHWACGPVETININVNAPKELLDFANEIMAELSDYPVLDDAAYARLVDAEVLAYWSTLNLEERRSHALEASADLTDDELASDYLDADELHNLVSEYI